MFCTEKETGESYLTCLDAKYMQHTKTAVRSDRGARKEERLSAGNAMKLYRKAYKGWLRC